MAEDAAFALNTCTGRQCIAKQGITGGMALPDFNLLIALDAVLAEGSVAHAAQRLRLSPSAMSRSLARLRETTGDPLLVRAGRGLVPTPRALELRELVSQLVQDAAAVLRPADNVDLKQLVRTFTLRTREGFVENFGAGVLRMGHAVSGGKMAAGRYANGKHIGVSRRGMEKGLIDEALAPLERQIVTSVGGFSSALALARSSDLIASVPERYTGNLREGMHSFVLPFTAPQMTISLLWHPRQDVDPAHRWLRGLVVDTCRALH